MMGNLERLANEDDIPLRPHDFTTNSHKSLLLAEAAKQAGADIFYRLHRRLFEAFFTDGLNIGDETVLAGLAVEAGVPPDLIRQAWDEPRYEDRLKQYLAAAAELDVRATPTIFFGKRQRLDGALPYSAFLKAARAGEAEQHAPPA
jgi:predicted DsbA family dithiol-disulfide isomerase